MFFKVIPISIVLQLTSSLVDANLKFISLKQKTDNI